MEQWPQVKEIFHAALERDPLERSAFLAGACHGDAMLYAEVERLLAAHMNAAGFIEPRASPVGDGSSGNRGGPPSMSGRIVGRYEIGRLVGAGGMGEVYVARDLELGREVAIKVATGGDDDAHARLRREAQHASQLNHPHICTIHEVGTCDGQPFIVMEHVAGDRLSDLIRPDGLHIDLVQRYGVQMADAVAHAHSHGVVHRDLKSSNIVVTPDSRIKILDFGLARRVSGESLKQLSESHASIASESEMVGTLSCMAPELLRGEAAGERSDIWAVGVLLYEMAAGRRPFDGATGFELVGAILHELPAPLPDRVPGPLQKIIRRCLAKNPVERYGQAGEVRAALESVQLERRRMPRARWRIGAAIVGLATLLAFVPAWYRLYRPAPASAVAVGASGQRAIAVMTFENVGPKDDESAWLSSGVPRMLLTGLAQTRGLEVVSAQRMYDAMRASGAQSLESLDRSQIPEVARRAGAGAVVVGSIFRAGPEIRIDAQLEDLVSGRVLVAQTVRGTDLFALVDQLSVRIRDGLGVGSGNETRRVADVSTASLEAYRLYSLAVEAGANLRFTDAQKLLEQAVALDPTFAEAYLELAFDDGTHMFTRKDYLEKAQEHVERLDERHRLLLQAALAMSAGKPGDSARILDDIMARFPDVDRAFGMAFELYHPGSGELQNPEKAMAIAQAAVKASPSSPSARNNYGYALLMAGRYAEAISEFQAYMRIAPREPNPYDSIGEAYLVMGEPEKALESYSRALAIDPTFPSHDARAHTLAAMGRYDEAVLETPWRSPFVRAQVLSRVGRYREAEQVVADGIKKAEATAIFGRVAGLHLMSALLAIERKDYARALQQCGEAEKFLPRMTGDQDQGRENGVLVAMISGIAESRRGRRAQAQEYLAIQKRSYRPASLLETSWYGALDGEIALAAGDLDRAAHAFGAVEMSARDEMMAVPPVLPNVRFPRDGPARVAVARGDLQGAIQDYRRLLAIRPGQWSVPMFEPRYVLEIARLLEQSGDKQAAKQEYQRFLGFWKAADAGLPEVAEARAGLAR